MNNDSTEGEYLLKSKNLTWEYVEVFEDYFGPVTLNDREMKDEEAQVSPAHTSAKNKSEIPCVSYLAKRETFSDVEPSRSINEEVSSGTYVYIRPSTVFSVHIVLSNRDIVEQNIDSDVQEEISSQKLVPPQMVFKSNDKRNSSAPYRCSIGNKPFPDKSNLAGHFRSHTGEKPFSCPQCEKTFSTKGHLKTHLLIHSGTKDYSCDICRKTFTQKGQLKSHLLIHSATEEYRCDICYKTFVRKHNLKAHLLIHSGTKEHSCDICHKRFTQKKHLDSHLVIHSGTKQYSCEICYKTFAWKGSLTTHRRIHTGEKPYECKECKVKFAQIQALHYHMRKHTR